MASITLGRSHGNDLSFLGDDAGIVSARHALVALKGHTLWLRDLDSKNGTFVGKVRVTERELLGGEVISLGPMGPAMRVTVMDALGESLDGTETLTIKGRDTTAMPIPELGLLAGTHGGNQGRIREMARRLRSTDGPHQVMQGLLRDPERLARLLKGGIMPERMGGWLGGIGSGISSSRKRILWAGIVLGSIAFCLLSVLGFQNFSYRAKIKKQGNLLSQIHELEKNLEAIPGSSSSQAPLRGKLVHQLLDAEHQLFQIREKLKLPDRAPAYRLPLGNDVHQVLAELGKRGFIIPESFILAVQNQIDILSKPENRATLQKCFARKPKYETLIRQELARLKLPEEFFYLAMQESLLDSAALSGNDARGLWQLVPETARQFDLKVPDDWETRPAFEDERTRPRASTRAAAKYLHLLYSEFGDAALAMAAYNAGGNKLRKVLRQIEDPVNDRDFWYLYRMNVMPEETNQYVPRIIAMILIDQNRTKYGF